MKYDSRYSLSLLFLHFISILFSNELLLAHKKVIDFCIISSSAILLNSLIVYNSFFSYVCVWMCMCVSFRHTVLSSANNEKFTSFSGLSVCFFASYFSCLITLASNCSAMFHNCSSCISFLTLTEILPVLCL